MRKFSLSLIFLVFTFAANAIEVAESFTYSKDFWQNSIAVSQDLNYMLNIGLDFDLTKQEDIKNHIYTFSLPIMFRSESFGLFFRPFFIPDNSNEASAFGAKASFNLTIKQDEVENSSSDVFFTVGFARQDAYVNKKDLSSSKENFDQLVYGSGLVFNYFDIYFFEISGNIFEYPSGISSVASVAGVLDQQNIASLDTLNYVLYLPKGSAGARIRWNSEASQSVNTLSYRFIEFQDQNIYPQHSLLLNSLVMLKHNFYISLAYNHIFIDKQKDKDIFKGSVFLKF